MNAQEASHNGDQTSDPAMPRTRHLHAVNSGAIATYSFFSDKDPVSRPSASPELLAEGQAIVEAAYGEMGHMGEGPGAPEDFYHG